MRDTLDDVVRYYETNGEDARLATTQQLEFLVTTHILATYLPPSSRILELGAGVGHYTAALAVAGHDVTGVELVPSLAALAIQRIAERGVTARARVIHGDARDFAMHDPYDVVLVMGPLYHLVDAEDREALMQRVRNVVRSGGRVLTTHLTRVGLVGFMLARFPHWAITSPNEVAQIMEHGFLPHHPRNGEFRGYFTTIDDVLALHAAADLEVIALHSQDPCIGSVDEIFSQLPETEKLAWARVLAGISGDPLALGSGRSLLCVSSNP